MPISTHLPVEDYFKQADEGALTPDMTAYIKWLTFETSKRPCIRREPISFCGMIFLKRHLKYMLAFASYGLVNSAYIDEKMRPFAIHALNYAIQKMKHEVVWVDWRNDGFGDDPIVSGNIMYKGHLHLMYGLYQLLTDDKRYEQEYKTLSDIIIRELNDEKTYTGFCCEPDNYFPQCNSIAFYSPVCVRPHLWHAAWRQSFRRLVEVP